VGLLGVAGLGGEAGERRTDGAGRVSMVQEALEAQNTGQRRRAVADGAFEAAAQLALAQAGGAGAGRDGGSVVLTDDRSREGERRPPDLVVGVLRRGQPRRDPADQGQQRSARVLRRGNAILQPPRIRSPKLSQRHALIAQFTNRNAQRRTRRANAEAHADS
jgi:hypothetical protein